MSATNIRQQLHQYVDQGDEKLLKLLYALAKEYNSENDFEFTSDDIQQFEARSASRLKEESKIYTVKEARDSITGSENSL
jgi:hypothetical protein